MGVRLGWQVEIESIVLIVDWLLPVAAVTADEEHSHISSSRPRVPLKLDSFATKRSDRLWGVNFRPVTVVAWMAAIINPSAHHPDAVALKRPGPIGQEGRIPFAFDQPIFILNVACAV